MADKRTSDKPFTISDPDGMPADELKAVIEANPTKTVIETVYDPVQEIVNRLDRIAVALEEQNLLVREELVAKGIVPPKKG